MCIYIYISSSCFRDYTPKVQEPVNDFRTPSEAVQRAPQLLTSGLHRGFCVNRSFIFTLYFAAGNSIVLKLQSSSSCSHLERQSHEEELCIRMTDLARAGNLIAEVMQSSKSKYQNVCWSIRAYKPSCIRGILRLKHQVLMLGKAKRRHTMECVSPHTSMLQPQPYSAIGTMLIMPHFVSCLLLRHSSEYVIMCLRGLLIVFTNMLATHHLTI